MEARDPHVPLSMGEMVPTLQDVSYLLGLPLAGEVIRPMEAPLGWRDAMQARFAGVAPVIPSCFSVLTV